MDLAPPELWLLARLGERAPVAPDQLPAQLGTSDEELAHALAGLRARALVTGGGQVALTDEGRAAYERVVAARCASLREALHGWSPDDHDEVRELIDRLGRDLVTNMPRAPVEKVAEAPSGG